MEVNLRSVFGLIVGVTALSSTNAFGMMPCPDGFEPAKFEIVLRILAAGVVAVITSSFFAFRFFRKAKTKGIKVLVVLGGLFGGALLLLVSFWFAMDYALMCYPVVSSVPL